MRNWFNRIPTKTWRAFLGASTEKHTVYVIINSTGINRDQPNRHYANRTNYRVQALKVTALVDFETLISPHPLDHVKETRREDRGYDAKAFRKHGVQPLIKHVS